MGTEDLIKELFGEMPYKPLVEEVKDFAIFHIDTGGAILSWNTGAEIIFGYAKDEIIGQAFNVLFTSEDRLQSVPEAELKKALETGRAEDTRWLLRKDGSLFFASGVTTAIRGENGTLRGYAKIARDETERKRIQAEREELLHREQSARREATSILDRITDGFISVDREWRYTYINRACALMAGLTPENFLGKTIWEVNPDAAGTKFKTEYERALRENVPVSFIEYLEWVDLWLEVNAYPSESGLSVFFRDVTLKVRLEEERTKLLEREQEARFQAEEANRVKDEFLATLSHELRTPLNAILGWSQMLQMGSVATNQIPKALATIERNARAQTQLIDDLLDVSRIITGKLRLNRRPVDLANVITAAVETVRPAAEAKEIELQISLASQASISGDLDRLQQIVWNLLSNAVKFTPTGGRIEAKLEKTGDRAEIIVADTGAGISKKFLPYVFERFRQSDGSMSRRHGGLGLGLAIVRQIVELHGGKVSVESEGEGRGTAFKVNFPLLAAQAEGGNQKLETRQPDERSDCPPELSGLRALVVDDESDSLDLINLLLGSCGIKTAGANSAAKGYELLQREKFDIIISDIGMPEEDGFTLIGRIRELPAEKGGATPAIALTAYAGEDDRARAMDAGFQAHVSKPFEPAKLIKEVSKLARANFDTSSK